MSRLSLRLLFGFSHRSLFRFTLGLLICLALCLRLCLARGSLIRLVLCLRLCLCSCLCGCLCLRVDFLLALDLSTPLRLAAAPAAVLLARPSAAAVELVVVLVPSWCDHLVSNRICILPWRGPRARPRLLRLL